ncbi:MAG: hypothetical protein HYY64_19475 [Candidatus Rokubacteria bacterium]|nr:hypothetical protein [Candidatus Rokubacteria bacterium]
MKRFSVLRWLCAGIAGSLAFWYFQILTGGATITQFMGEQIVTEGGYLKELAPFIGWAVHLAVSFSYALVFAVIIALLPIGSSGAIAAAGLVLAALLGWITTLLTAPAIAVTIGVLSGHGFPAELPGLNTEVDLPLYNHLLFFGVVWFFTALVPAARGKI